MISLSEERRILAMLKDRTTEDLQALLQRKRVEGAHTEQLCACIEEVLRGRKDR